LALISWINKPARWSEQATLDLHNAEAGAIADASYGGSGPDAWPQRLDLRGFTFSKLVAFKSFGESRAEQPTEILTDWLRRDQSGSPQPYTHLAKVLRDAGEQEKAQDILYAGRERQRTEAMKNRSWAQWLGLSALKWTIGYGLGARYFRALWWVGGLVLIGVATLYIDQVISGPGLAPKSRTLAWMIAASLDALLPIVSLDKAFDVVPAKLASIVSRTVFWLLGAAGWALGSFLVAGLAGLTQKPS
jgi:hypothetical protein